MRITPRVRDWLNAEAVARAHDHAHHHDHDHDHDHAHDRNRHDAHIRAYCLTGDKPFAPSSFEAFIELLRGTHGPRLLRVKGIVALADDVPVTAYYYADFSNDPADSCASAGGTPG